MCKGGAGSPNGEMQPTPRLPWPHAPLEIPQQQPPPGASTLVPEAGKLTRPAPDDASCWEPTRSLICLAMVRKDCSTFVEFFADVSRKGIPSRSANSYCGSIIVILQTRRHCAPPSYLGSGILHLALGGQIGLVPHQQLVDALGGVAINLLHPLVDIGKAVCIRNVIDDNDSVRAAIVAAGDGSEALLSCRVPLHACPAPA